MALTDVEEEGGGNLVPVPGPCATTSSFWHAQELAVGVGVHPLVKVHPLVNVRRGGRVGWDDARGRGRGGVIGKGRIVVEIDAAVVATAAANAGGTPLVIPLLLMLLLLRVLGSVDVHGNDAGGRGTGSAAGAAATKEANPPPRLGGAAAYMQALRYALEKARRAETALQPPSCCCSCSCASRGTRGTTGTGRTCTSRSSSNTGRRRRQRQRRRPRRGQGREARGGSRSLGRETDQASLPNQSAVVSSVGLPEQPEGAVVLAPIVGRNGEIVLLDDGG
mmetsp:Transcript_27540/g.59835  ORF Transcript_27540/g.59835 Transcript_27540/m.59835 type:complete len:278 (-) Transcript_27540:832-1665(-)